MSRHGSLSVKGEVDRRSVQSLFSLSRESSSLRLGESPTREMMSEKEVPPAGSVAWAFEAAELPVEPVM